MPINVLMPALSPTMTEGKIARWLKAEGDTVKSGQVLCEIETDKATMEVEAVDEGTLAKILVPGGTEGVKVNQPIAIIAAEGEDAKAVAASGGAAAPAPKAAAAPAPVVAPQPAASGGGSGAAASGTEKPAHAGDRVFASPLAKRMAEQAGLDLGKIKGSGPGGRIVKHDVEAAISGGGAKKSAAPAAASASAPAPAAVSSSAIAGIGPHKLVPLSTMRKVIARRLTESKQQVPHFYLTVDCEIDKLLAGRAALNAKSPEKGPGAFKLSVNDFIIKAVAVALRQVPNANASYSDDGMLLWDNVDISVAVAIPGGLITPIVKDADKKGLVDISNAMKDLAARAKDGKLKPEEFQGGTFSISNLGMFGIKDFAAVINPPQGCILAVGAGEQRPVVKNGALAIATVMSCTLSVDHRVVDGAVGAEFLSAFKKIVEDPLAMLL
ncbi:MAG: pyruvate dehydrogenase complex dihydrolipoamide acetyltransferase [Azospirillum sp.]|nr:pyruvate dehydrogenase complex dihydrolipoamide acetyltransferase [Azospirillum sp.]MCA3267844.1 pyruvate dehydrogenase complex dihydrolipoamide acetyltransferase [Azospirillum sp.]MCZ8123089.1 pyruvate dehydrogenase complex dihydrolipoamide acetyltransferase [Magnetospirillum sp.]